jgi:hypothetical protein
MATRRILAALKIVRCNPISVLDPFNILTSERIQHHVA